MQRIQGEGLTARLGRILLAAGMAVGAVQSTGYSR